ncbi:hypothetical protein TetV_062 [Tetraselmis virus 1]|uniref:Uncharacterized protein n=1 Tax=Tetraselmis virus 1 TaxID=2060617 RepID=A0A2P0VMM6_9VIRU|nr:hypothetical protein QJ968_gp062 [Tetraselmis virus 1]AUF82154.1 hypothetical protein TetV_062 [Tetraselmis virus 1]
MSKYNLQHDIIDTGNNVTKQPISGFLFEQNKLGFFKKRNPSVYLASSSSSTFIPDRTSRLSISSSQDASRSS